jgi:hypothetical protein
MLQNRPRTTPSGANSSSIVVTPTTSRTGGVIRWFVGSSGLMLVGAVVVIGAELLLPYNAKISNLVGSYFGNEQASKIIAELKATQADAAIKAEAAVRAQQLVEQYRSKTERLTGVCQGLYQQVGTLNQIIANAQEQYIAKRQDLLASTMAGDIAMANINQISPAYGRLLGAMNGILGGDPNDANRAHRTPQQILDQYDRAMQDGMEKAMANIRRWQPGIGKMATIDSMVPSDCIKTPEMAPEITPPPPPSRYDRNLSRKS